MVAEEHELWEREAGGEATDSDRQKLETLRVSLDQCWDLLRQRRARRDAGRDPDPAELRAPEGGERGGAPPRGGGGGGGGGRPHPGGGRAPRRGLPGGGPKSRSQPVNWIL